jgi:hypothetical protein
MADDLRIGPADGAGKTTIAAELKETNNCQTYHDRSEQFMRGAKGLPPDKVTEMFLRDDDALREDWCKERQRRLKAGGDFKEYPDTGKYLAINAATAVSAFVVIYGLAFLLPALGRRYWQWLKNVTALIDSDQSVGPDNGTRYILFVRLRGLW